MKISHTIGGRLIVCFLASAILLTLGCTPDQNVDSQGRVMIDSDGHINLGHNIPCNFRYAVFDGHEYTILDGFRRAGIAHSPKCPCRVAGHRMEESILEALKRYPLSKYEHRPYLVEEGHTVANTPSLYLPTETGGKTIVTYPVVVPRTYPTTEQ